MSELDRVAWLGSAEGWGLLGLPLSGGPLTYLGSENLESPTWAPPDLGDVSAAWPGEGSIWIQFSDSRIVLYDYLTGHLLNFDSLGAMAQMALALEGTTGLVVARTESSLELVAESPAWNVRLEGSLGRLANAGSGRVVAVVEAEPQKELIVLQPPETGPLGRRQVPAVRDLVVTAWGERLYYVAGDASDSLVHGLSLPELGDVDEIVLPEPARAIAATPSGHRLYIAAGQSLHVYDRLQNQIVGEIAVPGRVAALRFSLNGANLMAKLEGVDELVVLQVGVDSVLGVIAAEWDESLPVALPGGRLIVRVGEELVLYDSSRLVEIARYSFSANEKWLTVRWQPPRPRIELARRTASQVDTAGGAGARGEGEADDASAVPGHYAVVLAARQRPGVDDLVAWLRRVGYPGVLDRHRDVMGVEWFRAIVGPYPNRAQAEAAARSLGARYGYKPWILRIERAVTPVDTSGTDDASPADTVVETPIDTAGGAGVAASVSGESGGVR